MPDSGNRRTNSESVSYAHSVTGWLRGIKHGDQLAAQKIWDRYIERLIRRANRRLGKARHGGDAEDVVVVAFQNFFQRVGGGGFSKLEDRDDLWQILVMLTDRRAIDHFRKEAVELLVTEEPILDGDDNDWLETLPDDGPSPSFVAMFAEEFQAKMKSLDTEKLQEIVLLKMQGHKNAEIAEEIGISLRSVERKLKLIREMWQREPDDER